MTVIIVMAVIPVIVVVPIPPSTSGFGLRSTNDDSCSNIVHALPEAHDGHVPHLRFDNRDVR